MSDKAQAGAVESPDGIVTHTHTRCKKTVKFSILKNNFVIPSEELVYNWTYSGLYRAKMLQVKRKHEHVRMISQWFTQTLICLCFRKETYWG